MKSAISPPARPDRPGLDPGRLRLLRRRSPPLLPTTLIGRPPAHRPRAARAAGRGRRLADAEAPPTALDPEISARREVILGNVIKLMQTASTNPGGPNFAIATDNLNELFEQGTRPVGLTP